MRRLLFVVILALLGATSSFSQSATSSVTLDQPALHFGDVISFTSVYPQEARLGGRTPQYEFHPRLQIDCFQSGVHVVPFYVTTDPEGDGHSRNSDGTWTGHSTSFPLTLAWIDNVTPAQCVAVLWNPTDKQGVVTYTIYATLDFEVAP